MNAVSYLPERIAHRLGTVSEIVEAVAAVYALTTEDIFGRARSKAIAEARCCVYLIAKRCTRLSYPEIAFVLKRDHTTVMSGVKSAERLCEHDRWASAAVAELMDRFGEIEEVTEQ